MKNWNNIFIIRVKSILEFSSKSKIIFTSNTREDVTHDYLICVEAQFKILNLFSTTIDSTQNSVRTTSDIKLKEQSRADFPDNVMSDKDFNHTNDASQLESKILPKLIIFINHTKLSVIQSVLRLNYLLNSKYDI